VVPAPFTWLNRGLVASLMLLASAKRCRCEISLCQTSPEKSHPKLGPCYGAARRRLSKDCHQFVQFLSGDAGGFSKAGRITSRCSFADGNIGLLQS
jgi:hypothetical protein